MVWFFYLNFRVLADLLNVGREVLELMNRWKLSILHTLYKSRLLDIIQKSKQNRNEKKLSTKKLETLKKFWKFVLLGKWKWIFPLTPIRIKNYSHQQNKHIQYRLPLHIYILQNDKFQKQMKWELWDPIIGYKDEMPTNINLWITKFVF